MKLETLQEARHISQERIVKIKIDQKLLDEIRDMHSWLSKSDEEIVNDIDNFLQWIQEDLSTCLENLDWFNY